MKFDRFIKNSGFIDGIMKGHVENRNSEIIKQTMPIIAFADDSVIEDALVTSGNKFWVIATHSDVEINNRIYIQSEITAAIDTWIYPYQKPVLKHHNDWSDPVGKVLEAIYFTSGELGVIKDMVGNEKIPWPENATGAVLLKVELTDQDMYEKVRNGAFNTVSVGMFPDRHTCSICGKDLTDYDACPHRVGKVYDGKKCVDIPKGFHYKELSFATLPADEFAFFVGKVPDKDSSVVISSSEGTDSISKEIGEEKQMEKELADRLASLDAIVKNLDEKLGAFNTRIEKLESIETDRLNVKRREVAVKVVDGKTQLGLSSYQNLTDDEKNKIIDKLSSKSLEELNEMYSEISEQLKKVEDSKVKPAPVEDDKPTDKTEDAQTPPQGPEADTAAPADPTNPPAVNPEAKTIKSSETLIKDGDVKPQIPTITEMVNDALKVNKGK